MSEISNIDEIRKVELDMLKTFIEICNKYELMWFAVGGTCLGAVRHKGFIPWDDDIDVAMPRKDYDRFVEIAQMNLPYEYFLQTHNTDRDYRNDYAKIRNSETTFIEKSVSKLKINHGIYIDIFPIDGMPSDKKEIRKLNRHKRFVKVYMSKDYIYSAKRSLYKRIIYIFLKIFGHFSTTKMLNKLEKHYKKFSYDDCDMVVCHGGAGDLECFYKKQYGKGVFVDFEDIYVRIPEKYDEYLTQKYNNYMQLPPEEKRIGHHYTELIDTLNSYRVYTGKKNKTIITYGTFDLLHYGHINLLKRAKSLGGKLIVGVSTDECCLKKGKETRYKLDKRMQMVSDLRFVDLVIPEADMHQKVEDIKKYHVDVFVLGDDYKESFLKMEEYHEVAKQCEIVFFPRTKGVSTTLLKQQL